MKKNVVFLLALTAVVAILFLVFRSFDAPQPEPEGRPDDSTNNPAGSFSDDDYDWVRNEEIPPPDMDEAQVRHLWPDVFEPAPDREKIKRQWTAFSHLYPNNLYIPTQFLPEQSEEESKRRIETLGVVTHVQSQIAALRAATRDSEPGSEAPPAPSEPTVTPAEQRTYFNYRIRQLTSKLQLAEYYVQNNDLSAERQAQTEKEMAEWNAQVETYKKLLEKLPRD